MDSKKYTSNPFRAFAAGMANILHVNPVVALGVPGLLILILLAIALLALAFGTTMLSGGIGSLAFALILLAVIAFLAILRFTAAITIGYLESAKHNQITIETALQGPVASARFWTYVGATLLTTVAVVAGIFLFVIPGLILAARFSLVPFVVYGENLGVLGSIKRSWALTSGHTIEMLAANASSIITIGSDSLIGISGPQAVLSSRYHQLVAAKGEKTGSVHWSNYVVAGIASLLALLYFAVVVVTIIYPSPAYDSSSRMFDRYSQFDDTNVPSYRYR